jgi:hypothetical protein
MRNTQLIRQGIFHIRHSAARIETDDQAGFLGGDWSNRGMLRIPLCSVVRWSRVEKKRIRMGMASKSRGHRLIEINWPEFGLAACPPLA